MANVRNTTHLPVRNTTHLPVRNTTHLPIPTTVIPAFATVNAAPIFTPPSPTIVQPLAMPPVQQPGIAIRYGGDEQQQALAAGHYNPCDFGLCATESAQSQSRHGITSGDVGAINNIANGGGGSFWQGMMKQYSNPGAQAVQASHVIDDKNNLDIITRSPQYADAFNKYVGQNGGNAQNAQYMALGEIGGVGLLSRVPGIMASVGSANQQGVDVANNRAAMTNTDASLYAPGMPRVLAQDPTGAGLQYEINGQTQSIPMEHITPSDVVQSMARLNQPLGVTANMSAADSNNHAKANYQREVAMINQSGANSRALANIAAQKEIQAQVSGTRQAQIDAQNARDAATQAHQQAIMAATATNADLTRRQAAAMAQFTAKAQMARDEAARKYKIDAAKPTGTGLPAPVAPIAPIGAFR
jgi:hypothetical protein